MNFRLDDSGGTIKQTVFYLHSSGVELWACGVNLDDPTFKLGYFQPAGLVNWGGYLGANANQVFLDPSANTTIPLGDKSSLYLSADYTMYSDGSDNLLCGEAKLTCAKWKKVVFGPDIVGSKTESAKAAIRGGIAFKAPVAAFVVSGRYLPFGTPPHETARLTIAYLF
jgi:hypothetical protein